MTQEKRAAVLRTMGCDPADAQADPQSATQVQEAKDIDQRVKALRQMFNPSH